MDPVSAVGIATGIIGLLPICADGCTFLVGLCRADSAVQEQMIRIRAQRAVLRSWGTTWEIPVKFDPEGKKPLKLQKWIEAYPESGMDVLDILSAISDVFADTSSLVERYGITLKQRDPALQELNTDDLFSARKSKMVPSKDVEHRRQHMNIVNRCHFQLKGGAKFDALIARIIEHVDSLFKMCSANLTSAQKIERASLNQVSVTQDPIYLQQLSKVMGEEASRRRKAGQRYRGDELAKDVADFKARVRLLAAASTFFKDEEDFEFGDKTWKFTHDGSTLAFEKSSNLIRYILKNLFQSQPNLPWLAMLVDQLCETCPKNLLLTSRTQSLGVVLIEIGLWQSLKTFERENESPWGFQQRLIHLASQELPGQVGQIYACVVKQCLNVSEYDKDEDTQQKLCWEVVSMLDQCVA
ncbi:MAG: hypothetical protein Q9195_009066 [Heterodermia aff. obscurata]